MDFIKEIFQDMPGMTVTDADRTRAIEQDQIQREQEREKE